MWQNDSKWQLTDMYRWRSCRLEHRVIYLVRTLCHIGRLFCQLRGVHVPQRNDVECIQILSEQTQTDNHIHYQLTTYTAHYTCNYSPSHSLNTPFNVMHKSFNGADCDWSVAWHSGRTLVFDRRTFPVLCSTCSWWMTTYVGKPSTVGQPTRPTQPFILSGWINE